MAEGIEESSRPGASGRGPEGMVLMGYFGDPAAERCESAAERVLLGSTVDSRPGSVFVHPSICEKTVQYAKRDQSPHSSYPMPDKKKFHEDRPVNGSFIKPQLCELCSLREQTGQGNGPEKRTITLSSLPGAARRSG